MANKHITWDEYYSKLIELKKETGDVNVFVRFVYKGFPIGRWLSRMRNLHSKGGLSQIHTEKLEQIGVVWNLESLIKERNEARWEEVFLMAKQYYEEHGNLRMPRNYLIDGFDVGNWITAMISAYRGTGTRKITQYQIDKLESIGIEWDYDFKEDLWNRMYALAESYFEEFGNISIPQGKDYKGFQLGTWVHTQKQAYKKGKLTKEREDKLKRIGIIWSPYVERWNEYYDLAKRYYEEIGNLDVPKSFEIDGFTLGRWIAVQREYYHGREDGTLTNVQIEKLNSIGMLWKGNATTQTSYKEQVIYFYCKKIFPSTISRYSELGIEIDVYIPELKVGIEYDGNYWHQDKLSEDEAKDILCKEHGISLIRFREKGLKPTSIATNYVLANDSILEFERVLKQAFHDIIGDSSIIDIKRDSFEIVKIYKSQINLPWYKMFQEAKAYYHQYGNLLVSRDYVSDKGFKLGCWIRNQRNSFKLSHNPLSPEQITLLESIGMVWDVRDYLWDKAYQHALSYYKNNGNLAVSRELVFEGFRLGKWINTQRTKFSRGKMDSTRRERLEEIGMIWNTKNIKK